MHTGQYYYKNLPNRIKVEFCQHCKVRFDYVMSEDYNSLSDMIDDAISPAYTIQGREYWEHISQAYEPTTWTKSIVWIDNNANRLLIGTTVIMLLTILLCSMVVLEAKEKEQRMEAKIKRQDSINLINRANHIVDSTNAANALYYGGNKSKFKGSITLDSANKWMDKVMDENKVGE